MIPPNKAVPIEEPLGMAQGWKGYRGWTDPNIWAPAALTSADNCSALLPGIKESRAVDGHGLASGGLDRRSRIVANKDGDHDVGMLQSQDLLCLAEPVHGPSEQTAARNGVSTSLNAEIRQTCGHGARRLVHDRVADERHAAYPKCREWRSTLGGDKRRTCHSKIFWRSVTKIPVPKNGCRSGENTTTTRVTATETRVRLPIGRPDIIVQFPLFSLAKPISQRLD